MTYTQNTVPLASTDDGTIHQGVHYHSSGNAKLNGNTIYNSPTTPPGNTLTQGQLLAQYADLIVFSTSRAQGWEAYIQGYNPNILQVEYGKSVQLGIADTRVNDVADIINNHGGVLPADAIRETWFTHSRDVTGMTDPQKAALRIINGTVFVMDGAWADVSATAIRAGSGSPIITAHGWSEFHKQDWSENLIDANSWANFSTTTSGITAANATSITVVSVANAATPAGALYIGSTVIPYTGISGNTFTGIDPSVITGTIASGTTVTQYLPYRGFVQDVNKNGAFYSDGVRMISGDFSVSAGSPNLLISATYHPFSAGFFNPSPDSNSYLTSPKARFTMSDGSTFTTSTSGSFGDGHNTVSQIVINSLPNTNQASPPYWDPSGSGYNFTGWTAGDPVGSIDCLPWDQTNGNVYTWTNFKTALQTVDQDAGNYNKTSQTAPGQGAQIMVNNAGNNAVQWYTDLNPLTSSIGLDNYSDMMWAECWMRPFAASSFDPGYSIPQYADPGQTYLVSAKREMQFALDVQADGCWFFPLTRMDGKTVVGLPGNPGTATKFTTAQYATWRQILVVLSYICNRGKIILCVNKDDNVSPLDEVVLPIYQHALGAPRGPSTNTITDNLCDTSSTAIKASTADSTHHTFFRTFDNGAAVFVCSDNASNVNLTFDRSYQDITTTPPTFIGTTMSNVAPGTALLLGVALFQDTDTGTGTDFTAGRNIYTPDSGTGTDFSKIIHREAGTGSDVSTLKTVNSRTESGTGSNTSTLHNMNPRSDSAIGTDVATVRVHVSGTTDTGQGIEISVERYTASRTESGHGADLSQIRTVYTRADSGSGSDASVQRFSTSRTDSSHGTETSVLRQLSAVLAMEHGTGSDASTEKAKLIRGDSAHGTDSATLLIKIPGRAFHDHATVIGAGHPMSQEEFLISPTDL